MSLVSLRRLSNSKKKLEVIFGLPTLGTNIQDPEKSLVSFKGQP